MAESTLSITLAEVKAKQSVLATEMAKMNTMKAAFDEQANLCERLATEIVAIADKAIEQEEKTNAQ